MFLKYLRLREDFAVDILSFLARNTLVTFCNLKSGQFHRTSLLRILAIIRTPTE